jgi:hypothetical protein
MKHILSLSALLLTTVLYISSCNPIDEEELNSSVSSNSPNFEQMSAQEVLEAIQGEWYEYRSMTVIGPTCAGGANENHHVTTHDLQYLSYKLNFTNIPSDPLLYGQYYSAYQVYTGGGSSTATYGIINSSTIPNLFASLTIQGWNYSLDDGAFYLFGLDTFLPLEIMSLTDDEMILYTNSLSYTNSGSLRYFKRSSAPVLPLNEQGLEGTFVWDNYKKIQSGVEVENTYINEGITYTFSNEIYYNSQTEYIHYKGQRVGPMYYYPYPYFVENEPQLGYYNNGEQGFFAFETTSSHLTKPSSSGFKVHELNENELILRDGGCISYKEYHFTKIN